MHVLRFRVAQQRGDVRLGGGGVKQVVTAHDLVYKELAIIDDDGEVVGPVTGLSLVEVAAAFEYDVVDGPRVRASVVVAHAPFGHGGAQAQGGEAAFGGELKALGFPLLLSEVSAGAGVHSGLDVGCAGCFADVAAGAVAFVDRQARQGGLVQRPARGLVDHRRVEIQPQRCQVLDLALGRLGGGTLRIDVLDAQVKFTARLAGEQPREHGGAQVSEVQVAAWRGCVSTSAHGFRILRVSYASTRSAYPVLVAVFCAVFLISNITAQKGVEIGPLITDGAFFLFPISYVIGDVIAEVYGFRAARRAVFTGFGIALMGIVSFYIAIWLPAADFYDAQDTFASVLGLLPRIVTASLAGYVVGQLLNAWVLQRMKDRFGAGNLWARLIGSTIVGEFADTLLFCAIAAAVIGIDTPGQFVNYVVVGFLWKTLMEVLVMPLTYAVVAWVRRAEDAL